MRKRVVGARVKYVLARVRRGIIVDAGMRDALPALRSVKRPRGARRSQVRMFASSTLLWAQPTTTTPMVCTSTRRHLATLCWRVLNAVSGLASMPHLRRLRRRILPPLNPLALATVSRPMSGFLKRKTKPQPLWGLFFCLCQSKKHYLFPPVGG